MSNLGDPKIDFQRFLRAAPVHEINGRQVDAKALIDGVSMISMKLNSENVDFVKNMTTEGMTEDQRIAYLSVIRSHVGSDVFELSTCNRVVYVGFSADPSQLEKAVLAATEMASLPFVRSTGMECWRHLVKICSGLDSFMLGELQIMGQFREAVTWHRDHGFVDTANGSFFDHVVSANRVLRREFGFTQTTESMLNLATNALESIFEEQPKCSTAVLGYGDMGRKAVESLLELGQSDITVVSRSPSKSTARHPDLAGSVSTMSFEEWNTGAHASDLVISTIRNTTATYAANHPLPFSSPTTVMDFSWPPSFEQGAFHDQQVFYGMEHWIRVAHKLGIEWDYEATVQKSESVINTIETKFMEALTQRTQSKFRAYLYQRLEELSKAWEQHEAASQNDALNMAAFSREIATWMCNQDTAFTTASMDEMIRSSSRNIKPALLNTVASDVRSEALRINAKTSLSEVIG